MDLETDAPPQDGDIDGAGAGVVALAPATVDTSDGGQHDHRHGADHHAGVGSAGTAPLVTSQVNFRSPSGQRCYAGWPDDQRVSGTAQDGIYEFAMTVPQGAQLGTWDWSDYGQVVDQSAIAAPTRPPNFRPPALRQRLRAVRRGGDDGAGSCNSFDVLGRLTTDPRAPDEPARSPSRRGSPDARRRRRAQRLN